jgi:hypothetical protein
MTKKINEASIKLDVNGLESEDFETLSRMLALAGQAETNTGSVGGMGGGLAPLKPMDFDSIGGEETQPIMNPEDAMSPASPADGAGDLSAAIDDLAGTVSDFGADDEESEMSLDMTGQPSVESSSEFEDEVELGDEVGFDDVSMELDDDGDDMFDMGRMSELAGIGESLVLEDDSAAEDFVNAEAKEDTDLDDAEEEAAASELGESAQILPDLSLEEDNNQSVEGNKFGPFATERDAVQDASQRTNGVEGDHFIVVPSGNQYYWKRTMQEELQNEPDPHAFDNDGIENSRHNYRHKRTALGDNPLLNNVRESEEVDADNDDPEDEETAEDIYESIAAKYERFLGGLSDK